MDPVTSQHPLPRRWPARTGIAATLLAVTTASLLWYTGKFDHNLREVSPGKVYRSAQMDCEGLKQVIAAKQIKSVVNLRGKSETSPWYPSEITACIQSGVAHDDFNIGLGKLPNPDALKNFIAKLDAGPYPMLMHCNAGADRSSLGAVFYLHLIEKVPLEEAEKSQLTWRFGHLPLGDAKSIDDFFALYHATANGQSLRDWVLNTYPGLYAERQQALSKK